MGKKQHSKDRMYITKTEWATEWGGAKSKELRTPFKRLPFYCCALTFTPFEVPVCTMDGSVFELMSIIPYIIKYGKHPVTGAPLTQDDLITLNFHKNSEGEIFGLLSVESLVKFSECQMSSKIWQQPNGTTERCETVALTLEYVLSAMEVMSLTTSLSGELSLVFF